MILNKRALAALIALSITAVAGCATETGDNASEAEDTSDLVSRSASFETFQGLDGQYYFHLVAANGENVLRSEGYERLAGAQNGVASVLENGTATASFALEQAMSGEWYFNLEAKNHEVIGTSQLYATKSSAERGERTVRGLVGLFGGASTASSSAAPKNQQFEIFKGEDNQTYFHLRAGNGEILLSSEGYKSKEGAENGVAAVEADGKVAASFQIVEAFDGGWAVRLVAGNNEIIARTETYATKSNAERAVDTIASILARDVRIAD